MSHTGITDKEKIIQHKKAAIRKINAFMEKCIDSDDDKLLKKADLISYWLESFSMYVDFEDRFDSTKIIRYSRGNIIRVNFGFNIGKELGGMHFAVVLDNDNKHSADVLTVIPLSSTEGRSVHPRCVDLGTELFEKANAVQVQLRKRAIEELEEINKIKAGIDAAYNIIENSSEDVRVENEKQFFEIRQNREDMSKKISELRDSLKIIERNDKEILKMKTGSMAVMNQITTISKQRIFTPKKSTDFLYDISLSANAMDKIDDKLRELYGHRKTANLQNKPVD